MAKRRLEDGQALVEAAVVLPLICLAIAITFQIFASCFDAVLLQKLAYERARDISSGTRTLPAWLTRSPLWGRGAVPINRQSSVVPKTWRPFTTPLTPRISAPGRITTVTLTSLLLPVGGFEDKLPTLTQQALAEAYVEPPVPKDE
jgi:hypothetical protein